jgi:glycosyltransferase involved in cell wall biosynthesis
MKVAFVVQRYGLEINGGAELHCRWVAEHLRKYFEVEVLTTRALDYVTWRNHYPEGLTTVNRVPVRAPSSGAAPRTLRPGPGISSFITAGRTSPLARGGGRAPRPHRVHQGPRNDYDFHLLQLPYSHSYWGVRAVPEKSLLVPTAERDPVTNLRIFHDLFRQPRALVYNSPEERAMINALSRNESVPGDVVGVGTEAPAAAAPERFRSRHGIEGDYLIYLGRIDENKGCRQLFDHFLRFKRETGSPVRLALVGTTILRIPAHPDLLYLGFLGEEDKFDGLVGAAALVMPSLYESLSMVTLEAWAMSRPVLANAQCEVLKGQCLRSNGGLFYESYEEFKEALGLLLADPRLREILGANGRRYFETHYTWETIENKYLALLNSLRGT